ncbi:hypothetical protein CLCR_09185 [Cladophialophora carrionii]|uniref:Uncharacterized protein n=1 Tax=Cladophialophora carrionii TaxID=86049 RepID=A0A1C1CUG4_9EURO|nr:hypothetical protein CLCR_09185 [Cladophialophora carrionii]
MWDSNGADEPTCFVPAFFVLFEPSTIFANLLPTAFLLNRLLQSLSANTTASECTPKALTHRITTIKKKAGMLSNGSGLATPASATPAAPASGKPEKPRKHATKSDTTANADSSVKRAMEDDDGGAPATKKAKAKGTRKGFKKRAPAAPDATCGEESKKLKNERDGDGEGDGDGDGVQE